MQINPQWLHWPETRQLIAALGAENMRFVGGCVRDALLSRSVQDVDVATVLEPQAVMERLKANKIKAIPTGIGHGTVTAVAGKKHFEVTTLRRDVSTDGRRATVAFTQDYREDASRRDFTMNALYAGPDGSVTDFFGGTEDAQKGIIRFIGDAEQRIKEDALRILRFFRFYAHYGSAPLDKDGLAACEKLASMIDGLSGERIKQEMCKLLVAGKAPVVVDIMQQAGVLLPVLGCKVDMDALIQLPALLHDAQENPDPMLALAALLRSAPGDTALHVQCVHARWKLSNAELRQLERLCTARVQLTGFEALTKRQIRLLGKQDFIHLMLLYAAEGASHDHVTDAIRFARAWEIPVFPVTGDDLLKTGVAQGKQLGETLRRLENEWEKGGYIATKEALLSSVK